MRKSLFFYWGFIFIIFHLTPILGQQLIPIYQLQGDNYKSPLNGEKITTHGILTATFNDQDQLKGFFIQDAKGDGNPETSDAIFIASSAVGLAKGDLVEITGTIREVANRTIIDKITQMKPVSSGHQVNATILTFPMEDDLKREALEGMLVSCTTSLTVINNKYLKSDGQLTLSASGRQPIPTQIHRPGSASMTRQKEQNIANRVTLDDGSFLNEPDPIPYLNNQNTRRVGSTLNSLQGIWDEDAYGYVIHPTQKPKFTDSNPRPQNPQWPSDGNINICGFNVLMFKTSLGDGYGADNQQEFQRQRKKLVATLSAIDADIFALCELQENQDAIASLTQELNKELQKERYGFVEDGLGNSSNFIKSGFIYNKKRVVPYKNLLLKSSRMVAQGFRLLENNGTIVVSMNHFKSKNCSNASGANKDQGDGQSCYNYRRTREARDLLAFTTTLKNYYNTDHMLILGDLNSHAKEDPIQILINGGFTNELEKWKNTPYSYVYHGESGTLDHALSSRTLSPHVLKASVWHINSDEPEFLDYNLEGKESSDFYAPTPFRSSDHDPVLVSVNIPQGPLPVIKSLKELRNQPPGNLILNFEGETHVSYARTSEETYFIQDSQYGIQIKDPEQFISSPWVRGDQTPALRGHMALDENGNLSFVIKSSPDPVENNIKVVANPTSMFFLSAQTSSFESRLITLKNVHFFSDAMKFFPNETYLLEDESGQQFPFVCSFGEADYINTEIPTNPINITGIIQKQGDRYIFTPRDLKDFEERVEKDTNIYLKTLSSNTFSLMNASGTNGTIYDIHGQIMEKRQFVSNEELINLQHLSSGIYILEIRGSGKQEVFNLLIISNKK